MFAKTTWIGIAVFALGIPAHHASAQNFPVKSIRLIVPLAAGGPGDVLARAIGQKLSESVAQPVIIDNRPGANTNVGNEFVAKAPPDGYTLLATASTLTINPSLYATLPYDPLRDLAPITLIASTPLILVVHPSLPVKSVKELIALARSKPGQLNYGSAGNGSALHLAGEMFNSLARVKLVHVPYKGVTNAFSDLLGGQISIMFPGAPIALPQVKAGKLRALGTTGAGRTAAAPELPPIGEAGLPGYEVSVWYGILAPAGTPTPVINRLHSELSKIVQLPEIKERWAVLGAEPLHNTPEQFAAFLKADLGKWAKVVRDSGAKID
ncbi:MAG: tripartite tricarboxylate transporter substrate binding protein [Betaproteobacteria bacterium]|nr:tripartite tricarboxylate transporter substrate binding protein [Betaproteobacteria bacterium]